MDRLLIVDGHNLLFQMFFGMPNKIINKDGKAIQGTLGFVGALLKIIKIVNPTHVVVLFDSENREVRNDIYSDYKGNRIDYSEVEEEDNPFSQLYDVYKALDYMNIKYAEIEKFETDDVIASYVFKYNEDQIYISSFDSDFFQLINDKVKVLRYRGDNTIICDEKYLKDKYFITPHMYPLFKSLVGDSADNIKGIPKVGIKTASLLLNEYNDIKCLIKNVDKIEKKSIKESLINNMDQLKRNYELVRLTNIAPIPFDKKEIFFINRNFLTNTILKEIGIK